MQPEISSPEETHGTPEKASPLYTQKTDDWDAEENKAHCHLEVNALTKHLVA